MDIWDRVSQRTSCFIRTGVQNLSKTRYATERRFQWEKSATMSRVVYGTTSVCAKRSQGSVGFNSRGATCWRPTSAVVRVDRISCGNTIVALETEWSHTHLVHVSLTSNNSTRCSEFWDSCGINWGLEPLKDQWSSWRLHSFNENVVFDSNWNAIK